MAIFRIQDSLAPADEYKSMDVTTARAGNKRTRRLCRDDLACHALAVVVAARVVVVTTGLLQSRLCPLLLLAAFTIIGALTDFVAGSSKSRVAGGTSGLVVAAVLLGPSPAAILGAATQVAAVLRTRAKVHIVVGNIATFA